MAKILILAAFVGFAYAGVGTLSPFEDAQKIQEYLQLCGSGVVSETGTFMNIDGISSVVYCKQEDTPLHQQFHHQATLNIPESPQQVLFVKPPDMTFRHNLVVTGIAKATKTNIYFVPPKVDSTVQVNVNPITERPIKPVVHFLERDGGPLGGYHTAESSNVLEDLGPSIPKLSFGLQVPPPPGDDDREQDYDYGSYDHGDEAVVAVGGQREIDSKPQKREADGDVTHVLRVNGSGKQGKTRLYVITKKT